AFPTSFEQSPLDDSSYPTFDLQAALLRAGGDRELLRRMVGVFALQWRQICSQIDKACLRHDSPHLEVLAKRLMTSLTSFGAFEASRLSGDLAARSRIGRLQDTEKACAELKSAIERLINDMSERL